MQNKNSKNLCLQIDDSMSRNNLIVLDTKHESRLPQRPMAAKLTRQFSEAQLYMLPPKMNSTMSSPASSPQFTTLASPCKNTFSNPSLPESPFNKPALPTLHTKFQSRPRANTIATSLNSIQTPHTEPTENTTRYWVFQENTPLSSNNFQSELNNGHSDDELDSYTETYKENCYPSGPLLVIPPSIYLYSEPSFDVVMEYDLIINVAKEITNHQDQLPHGKRSRYYHFTWSHTSKIIKNLPKLTELIHCAYKKGEKVLIHCQCGVSRSASLIVAYIMRYDRLSLNDAYNKLKSTAKDISPNMSLLFQLMEWEDWLKNCDQLNSNYGVRSYDSISEFAELSL